MEITLKFNERDLKRVFGLTKHFNLSKDKVKIEMQLNKTLKAKFELTNWSVKQETAICMDSLASTEYMLAFTAFGPCKLKKK